MATLRTFAPALALATWAAAASAVVALCPARAYESQSTTAGATPAADYRATLLAWLESHKRYPVSARERGEEGQAVLRFLVDRSGRVLNYAVITSSGYADLDRSVEDMMRGATLPPFPAGMPPRMEVSVTIRFSLPQPTQPTDAVVCATMQRSYDNCVTASQRAWDGMIAKMRAQGELNTNAGRAVLRAQGTPEENCAFIKAEMWRTGCPE
jgi:TonB family protein